eukprot:5589144-Lingulodinium_polyedra.AAC.1
MCSRGPCGRAGARTGAARKGAGGLGGKSPPPPGQVAHPRRQGPCVEGGERGGCGRAGCGAAVVRA